MNVERGGSIVDSWPFARRVVGSNPALAATYGPWAILHSQLPVTLRRETRIQYPCCVGSASEYISGLEEAIETA